MFIIILLSVITMNADALALEFDGINNSLLMINV